jgi:hypothetical protein
MRPNNRNSNIAICPRRIEQNCIIAAPHSHIDARLTELQVAQGTHPETLVLYRIPAGRLFGGRVLAPRARAWCQITLLGGVRLGSIQLIRRLTE